MKRFFQHGSQRTVKVVNQLKFHNGPHFRGINQLKVHNQLILTEAVKTEALGMKP